MRLLVLPALLLLPGAAPSAPAPSIPAPPIRAEPAGDMPVIIPGGPRRSDCPETAMSLARKQGERLAPSPLGDLPGADVYASVLRVVDGCEAPVVIRYDLGGRSPASALAERRP